MNSKNNTYFIKEEKMDSHDSIDAIVKAWSKQPASSAASRALAREGSRGNSEKSRYCLFRIFVAVLQENKQFISTSVIIVQQDKACVPDILFPNEVMDPSSSIASRMYSCCNASSKQSPNAKGKISRKIYEMITTNKGNAKIPWHRLYHPTWWLVKKFKIKHIHSEIQRFQMKNSAS